LKSIKEKKGIPLSKKEANFTKTQEAVRKDIERAFGVLQTRFAIVRVQLVFGTKKPL
jgi:hypothetical protein